MARPTTPLLDRERIANAAMALLDETGGFTIPALARELGVAPSSLYHHVDGRADIIAAIREQMVPAINNAAFEELDWRAACAVWARSYRDCFAAHPGCIQFLAVEPLSGTQLHTVYDRAVTALEKAGFPRGQVIAIITAIESFALGSALDLVAPPLMFADIDPVRTPGLAGALDVCPAGRARAEQAFEIGLEALLTGLAQLTADSD